MATPPLNSPKDPTWSEDESPFPLNTTDMYSIMQRSCLHNFDTVACIRSSTLSGLAILTSICCIGKLVKLHIARHPSCHQYVIFYTAALECVIGAIHWIFWNVSQLDFLLHYIKLLQVLLMCHYYITLAIRALRKENWADRFMYPFLFMAVLYFTVITTLGIFNTDSEFIECLAPYWLALSTAELLVVQMFFVSGFYITRRLNEISTLDSVRWAQKRDLWCIVIVFELSALGTFVFDLAIQILGDEETGCSAIFSYHQVVYSPVLVSLMVLKLLLPIWVMMLVFRPTAPSTKDCEEVMPGYSDDGTYGSIFSEDLAYRQLYQPGTDCFPYSCTTIGQVSSPCMQDPASPFAYTNPALVRSSSLQPIIEEGGGDSAQTLSAVEKKKMKKVRKVKSNNPKDPSAPKKKIRVKKVAKGSALAPQDIPGDRV